MPKSLIVLSLTVLLWPNANAISRVGPIIETKVGAIQGIYATDGDYAMFMGIPFAQVDDTNPFGNSLPQPNFEDVFHADDDSSVCAQRYLNETIMGVRDCLHLNIYVPSSANAENRVPVMVWIYGGAFTIGFNSKSLYGPKFLVKHDVILVTINYRVGPYGFMCLNIPEVPGNQGLKDQEAAFRWINNNIEAFGGDVNRITLFGESAGAMSIDLHLRSRAEKNYNNVILLSGFSLRGMLLVRDANPTAPMQIAEQLGFLTNDVYEALDYLRTVDTDTLIEATHQVGLEFRPCVEKYFENVSNFLTEHPLNVKPEKSEGMPILMGYNNDEQLYVYAHSPPEYFQTTNLFRNRLLTQFDFEDDKLNEMENMVRQFYLANEEISYLQRLGIIAFDSDLNFNYPAERSLNAFLENDAGDIYFYVLNYNGGRNMMRVFNNITVGGVSHSDGLGYLFDMHSFPNTPEPEDQLVIDRMTTMWTNFAKFGNPTPTTSELLPVKWEPITKDTPHNYMDINLDLRLRKKPFNQRMAFWKLFFETNAEFERGFKNNK